MGVPSMGGIPRQHVLTRNASGRACPAPVLVEERPVHSECVVLDPRAPVLLVHKLQLGFTQRVAKEPQLR